MKTILIFLFVLTSSYGFAQKGIIINSGANMQLYSGTTLVIGGDLGLINNSAGSVFDGKVIFFGTTSQEIGGNENTVFSVLDIDNNIGVFFNNDTRVADELILTNGVVDLRDFDMILSDVSTISGTFSAGNMINVNGTGNLIKEISGNDFFLLPVGDLTSTADYSPVEFDFTSGTYSDASVSVGVKNEKHMNNPSTNDYLNRYWSLSSSGISDFSCNMVFKYVSDDIIGNESNILGVVWENSSWHNLGQASSLQFSGTLNNFADVTGVDSQYVGYESLFNESLTVFYSNGTIFINSRNDIKIKNIEIYDVTGRLISVESINNTGNDEIYFSNTPGYYLLKINAESSSSIKKILVN